MSDAKDSKADGASEILDGAERALKRGHFAEARAELLRSEKSDEKSEAVAQRRARLWARLSPDPMIPWLVAACLILFVSLIAAYVH
jgi:hypothetical protein